MSVAQTMASELGVTLVTTVFGTIWTVLKSSELFRNAQSRRYGQALQALEAGVELTYRTYVRSIKESRQDGKLTLEEMRLARRRAREAAIEFGRTNSVDVLHELGSEYVDLLIAKLVKQFKNTR